MRVLLLIPFGKHKGKRQADWATEYSLKAEDLIPELAQQEGIDVGMKLNWAVRRQFPDVGEFMDVSAGYSDT